MNIPFVNLQRMHSPLQKDIQQAVNEVIDQNNYINGHQVNSFEELFARYLEVNRVVGVSSGTDALFLALKALGLKANEYVITVPNTFIATTEAITMAGGKVVLTEADEKTFNMDPIGLKKLLEEKGSQWRKNCRAIIFVNLYGNPAGLEEVSQISKEFGIPLISDAAQAHGARIKEKSITDFAEITTYSFFPGKNLGAFGDAGAIATNDALLADRLVMLRNHGRKEKYLHEIEAYNCRIDTLQAAVLEVKLSQLDKWNNNRIQCAHYYNRLLSEKGYYVPSINKQIKAVFHLYVIRVQQRDEIMKKLKSAGISCGVHYPIPIHLQPAYRYLEHKQGDFPISEKLSKEILSLPIDGAITTEEIDYIVSRLP